jgi:hypothetical protein
MEFLRTTAVDSGVDSALGLRMRSQIVPNRFAGFSTALEPQGRGLGISGRGGGGVSVLLDNIFQGPIGIHYDS